MGFEQIVNVNGLEAPMYVWIAYSLILYILFDGFIKMLFFVYDKFKIYIKNRKALK